MIHKAAFEDNSLNRFSYKWVLRLFIMQVTIMRMLDRG